MSRLTKKQALELYGRNLPTPTIDKVTLRSVLPDDDFYTSLDVLAAREATTGGELDEDFNSMLDRAEFVSEMVNRSENTAGTHGLTRITLDVSFYLTTWEGFDVEEIGRELFEEIASATGDGDTSNSLWINAAITFPPSLASGDSPLEHKAARRKNKLDLLPMFYDVGDRSDHATLGRLDNSMTGRIDYNHLAAIRAIEYHLNSTGADPAVPTQEQPTYEVSLPLSEFYSQVSITAAYDKDDNPIIKMSNIQLDFYVINFEGRDNIIFYAATSTAHPAALASTHPIDAVSYSINFSDLTYEDVKRDGVLNTISEPAFIDQSGAYYPDLPLRSLNKKYFKVDQYGPKQITDQIYALLGEYTNLNSDEGDLADALAEIEAQVITESNSIDFLLIMNQVAQVYSETNKVTRVTRLYERLRILIKNADSTLRNQEEVVSRIFRNYKVVDARAFIPPEFDSYSYVRDFSMPEMFLYQPTACSTVANFVPVNEVADWPGRTELPYPPSQQAEFRIKALQELQTEMVNLLIPSRAGMTLYAEDGQYGDSGITNTQLRSSFFSAGERTRNDTTGMPDYDVSDVAFTRDFLRDKLGWRFNENNPIHRGIFKMAWWAYNMWAARFIRQSEHKAYRDNDGFDGVQWWVRDYIPQSADWDSSFIRSRARGGDGSKDWNGVGTKNSRWWPPARWRRLAKSLSPSENEAVINWREVDDMWATMSDYYIAVYPDKYGQVNAAWCLEKFGFDPDGRGAGSDSTYSTDSLPHTFYGDTALQKQANRVPAFWYNAQHMDLEGASAATIPDPKKDRGKCQYWVNKFFWEETTSHEVWGIYELGQRDGQINVYVPRTGLSSDGSLGARGNPDDPGAGGYGLLDGTADGTGGFGGPDMLATYSMDEDASATAGWGAHWDRVGYIRAISTYTATDSDGTVWQNSGGQSATLHCLVAQGEDFGLVNRSDNISYVGVHRRKFHRIYKDLYEVVYRTLGVDPVAGPDVYAGGPEDDDASSTNEMTTLDTYIQEMPGIIAGKVIAEVCEWLDNLPYDHLDSNSDRVAYAAQAIDNAEALYLQKMSEYANSNALTFYLGTTFARNGEKMRIAHYGPVSSDGYVQERVGGYKWKNIQVFREGPDGEMQQAALPIGQWGLQKAIAKVGHLPDRSYEYYKHDFSEAVQQNMKERFYENRGSLQIYFRRYLETRQEYEKITSDIGIHSALSSVDIVLSKYGYFFFDLEKYIRKRSQLSQVLNVDRLMNNFPSAQEMTNASVQLVESKVKLSNFGHGTVPAPLYWDKAVTSKIEGDTTKPGSIELVLTREGERPHFPTNFRRLRFENNASPSAMTEDGTQIYNRIKKISEIRFDQITEYNPHEMAGGGGGFGGPTDMTATTAPDGVPPGVTGGAGYGGGGAVGGYGTEFYDPAGGGYRPDMRSGPAAFATRYRYTDFTAGQIAAQEAARDQAISDAYHEKHEVDIDEVTRVHGTADVKAHLVQRNYTFTSFENSALMGPHPWVLDYRLLCFKYQFYMDDDLAFSNNAHTDTRPADQSVDDLELTIVIRDDSRTIVRALKDIFEDEKEKFDEYVEEAEENCAFDAFDQRFNKFFVDAMTVKYGSDDAGTTEVVPALAPWFRMAATYVQIYNLFSDEYAGELPRMDEASANILENIRPETGTLSQLLAFQDAVEILWEQIRAAEIKAYSAEVADNGFTLSEDYPTGHFANYSDDAYFYRFTIAFTRGSRVIDHIGDYTGRENALNDLEISEGE
tara:strand:- start:1346 stop:6562 length:5217 start_codon:yes stop_codon:yes gene_type:complete